MVKKILNIFIFIIIIISFIFILNIKKNNYHPYAYNHVNRHDIIGKIVIKKLNINQPLYKIESSENTIEKNITILKESIFPNQKNSIIFIAAHSGTGNIAYFKDLDKLKKNDEIILEYKRHTYRYIVKEYWEEKKDGYINVNKDQKNQLILTTCSPNKEGYQLIINCIEKDKK